MGNLSTTLRPEVLSDLEDSTHFSAEEIRVYYKNFMKGCEETRMTMDVAQFQNAYSQTFPEGNASSFAEHVFRTFDRDGNGRIDFREFLMAVSIHQKGSSDDRLRWLFNMFDLDGTGFITHDELVELISALRKLDCVSSHDESLPKPEAMATFIMQKADKNKDNQLSCKEFIEGAKSNKAFQEMLQGTEFALTAPVRKNSFSKKK